MYFYEKLFHGVVFLTPTMIFPTQTTKDSTLSLSLSQRQLTNMEFPNESRESKVRDMQILFTLAAGLSFSSLYLYMHQNFPFITGVTEGTNCQTGRNRRISILPIFIPRPSRWAWTDRATLPLPGTSRDSATVHLSFRFQLVIEVITNLTLYSQYMLASGTNQVTLYYWSSPRRLLKLIQPFNQPHNDLIAILQDSQKARNINADYEKLYPKPNY